jgi:NAD(P)-dependent dehydrogenase (short-subunit alcohol dehydrogenase family)
VDAAVLPGHPVRQGGLVGPQVRQAAVAGKTVIVTGAAQGIGASFATALADEGANVVLADVVEDEGAALQHKLASSGARTCFVPADVTREDDVEQMARTATEAFGTVDALVNNAAIYRGLGTKLPFEQITCEAWDRIMTVNVRGVWQCTKAVVPYLRRRGGGKVVNLASVAALTGVPGFAHYAASKGAVIALTRALARELGRDNITVNAIAPGMVSNESSRRLNPGGYEEYAARVRERRALGHDLAPEDLVGPLLFLLSGASDFLSGQTLVVDGGDVMT